MFKNLSGITNQEIILEEKIDIKDADKLLHYKGLDTTGVNSLQKYLKHHKENGPIKVSYNDCQLGRLKIKATDIKENETLMTMPSMYNIMKGVLCKGIYYDIDIVNCHPILLSQLCKYHKIECPVLNNYIKNRDKIISNSGKNKNEFKKDLYKIMFNRFNKKGHNFGNDFLNKFNDELYCVSILLLDIYPNFRNSKIEENQEGQAMAILCQQMEKLTLLGLYQYCKNNDIVVGALIHDGLHCESKPDLQLMEEYIYNKLEIKINLIVKPFQDINLDNIYYVKNEDEGANLILEKINGNLIRSKYDLYIKNNDIWTNDEKKIKLFIKHNIRQYNILLQNKIGFSNISKSKIGINNLCELIFESFDIKQDDLLEDKLFKSNLRCICFNNGFFNMDENKFYKYENNNIYTRFKLSYDYEDPKEEDVKELYDILFDPVFNKNETIQHLFNNYVGRSIAGCYEDKDWMIGLGERDSGKGSYMEICKYTFEDYVKFTNAENFKYKENVSDVAKSYSWLVRLQGCRLLVSNEFEKRKKGGEVNGNMIKKICSGGDPIEARVNNKDEIEFNLQCKYMCLLNDIPEITPSDAKDKLLQFNYPVKFVEKDNVLLGTKNNIFEYKLGDPNIKKKLNNPKFRSCFFKIICEYYTKGIPIITDLQLIEDMKEMKEDENDELKFKELFEFTGKKEDYVLVNKIKKLVEKNDINMSAIKYCRIIKKEIGNTLSSRDGKKVRYGMKEIEQEQEEYNNYNELDI